MRVAKMPLVRPVTKNGHTYRQVKKDIPAEVRFLFPKKLYDPAKHKSPYMTALTRNVTSVQEEAETIAEFEAAITGARETARAPAEKMQTWIDRATEFHNGYRERKQRRDAEMVLLADRINQYGVAHAHRVLGQPMPIPVNPLDYRDVIVQWAKDKRLDTDDRRRTAKVSKCEAFFDWINQKRPIGHDMRQVTQDDMLSYRRHIIDQVNAGKMASKTGEDYLFQVKGLFTHAHTELDPSIKLASNPGAGVSYKGEVQNKFEGFTLPEIAKILTAARNEPPYIRWFHWLAAYSGGRCAEICEAPVKDVEFDVEAGCWVLHIRRQNRTGKMKTLKTGEISERPVPIHDAVIAEGFIRYAESVREAHGENAQLFPDLRLIRGRLNDDASNRNLEFLRRIGIATEANHKRNHSWRHVVKTRFRGTDTNGEHYIPREDVVDKLTGHANGSIGREYGYFPIPVLRNAISRIPAWSV